MNIGEYFSKNKKMYKIIEINDDGSYKCKCISVPIQKESKHVRFIKEGVFGWESREWWKEDNLRLNEIYEVTYYNKNEYSIDLKDKLYTHDSRHFEFVIDKTSNIENNKSSELGCIVKIEM